MYKYIVDKWPHVPHGDCRIVGTCLPHGKIPTIYIYIKIYKNDFFKRS